MWNLLAVALLGLAFLTITKGEEYESSEQETQETRQLQFGFPQLPIPQITLPPIPQITLPPILEVTIPPVPQISLPPVPGLTLPPVISDLSNFDVEALFALFDFSNLGVDPAAAALTCPTAFSSLGSCVVSDCPEFADNCPVVLAREFISWG